MQESGHGMSYIDREALIERLCYVCGADCDKNICTVKQTVEYMPDADVEPIRHGRWIDKGDANYYCSECDGAVRHNYPNCPFCRAKMEGTA